MAKDKKNGPITQQEKDFIRLNMKELSPNQIAEELGRNANTISTYITSLGFDGEKGNILVLKKREDWNMIKNQFSEEEITLFEWHWNEIVKQFRDELRFTESMQLVNAIKHEILGNRALTDQRKLTKQILETEAKIEKEREADPPDYQRIESLETLMGNLSAALEVNNREYRECNKKLSEALTSLKASREQRLSKVEDSKKSFPTWMGRLIEDKSMQTELGRYAAKMRLAIECEQQRLSEPYQYADQQIDRPLLNSDSVKLEYDVNKIKKEEEIEEENE